MHGHVVKASDIMYTLYDAISECAVAALIVRICENLHHALFGE